MVDDLSHFLDFASHAAKEGGKILKKYWGKLTHIKKKTYQWDLVTEADEESEKIILGLIKKEFPEHQILSEESGLYLKEDSEYSWIVDPLDGTTNYTHQYPFVAVSISLARLGKPILGVIYNPILEDIFLAAKGMGCTLNGELQSVSSTTTLDRSLLATGFAYDRKESTENNYAEFCHITQHSQGVRRGGSAALDLAYVAAGRLDGHWERGLQPWDIAAGIVCIQEAGGRVSSYEGTDLLLDSGRIVATNGIIHEELILELKKAKKASPDIPT